MTEDDAWEYYLEKMQEEYPFDITESTAIMIQLELGFYDWLEEGEVTINE